MYTYIDCMRKREWKGEEKMQQSHRKFGHRERLIQHAIELFDLVDITPATKNKVDFVVTGHHVSMTPSVRAGAKVVARQKTFALHARVC